MFLRKTNAVISLLTTVFLLLHAILKAVWMLSRGGIVISSFYISCVLAGLMVIHACISMDIVFSGLMGDETCKPKKYPKMNVSTIIQRISGVLLLFFSGLHVAGAIGYIQPPPVVHAIIALVFPTWTELPVLNFMHIHSFTVHILLATYPIMLTVGGDIKPSLKRLTGCVLLLLGMATVVFLINLLLDTNFMFLMYAEEGNPLLIFEELWGSHLLGFPVLLPLVMALMYGTIYGIRVLQKNNDCSPVIS